MNTQVLPARKCFRLAKIGKANFMTALAAVASAVAIVAAARDYDFYLYLCTAVALISLHASERFNKKGGTL